MAKQSSGISNLFGNLFWAMAGKIVNLISGLVVGIIIARYLGPEEYGLMNYVFGYVFLFQIFATFGLDTIETREEARRPDERDAIIGSAFALRILFGIIAVAACIVTSIFMEADLRVIVIIAIYSITILLSSAQVIRNYFFSIVRNEYVVKTEIVSTVIGILLKLILLWSDAPLEYFITVCALDPLLVAIGYSISYRHIVGEMTEWKTSGHEMRYLFKESLPLMLTNTAVIIYQRIDTVMIGQMISKESVGYFSVASRFVEVIIYIPMVLAQTIMPVLVSIRESNIDEYRRKGQLYMDLSVWVSFIVSLMVSLSSYWFITILFGDSYTPAVIVLQIMSFKAVSVALSNTAGSLLVTEGLQKWAIFRDGFGCIVCIALNYFLLPRYGVVAAAFTAIASNIAAGYIADAFIPQYRHLFRMQTKTILCGWQSLTPKVLRSIVKR